MAVNALSPICPLPTLAAPRTGEAAPPGSGGFGQLLGQMLASNQQANAAADQAIQALATGQAEDLHSVSLAVAQADLSFRMILEMRNRLTEAYQDITRMQV